MTMSELIARMEECEVERFIANDYRGLADVPEFQIVPGTIPVMVSAPHAVTHWRDGGDGVRAVPASRRRTP